MSALEFDRVTFSYAAAGSPVLRDVALEIPEGAFALLVGTTGSGKSTMLRLAKPEVAPVGDLFGTVKVFGEDVRSLDPQGSARAVGLVLQNPDAQVVCDTVWREMAFGLENLGVPEPEMRRRVAETCNFLGIEPWFRARTAELSGGQRQVLALAATLAMRPRVLLLDEPTSMLDPLAEKGFLSLLFRANRELGITVVVATHSPETMAEYATCAFELVGGSAMPISLEGVSRPAALPRLSGSGIRRFDAPLVRVSDAWLRYGRDARWVLRGLDLEVGGGEVRALVGSNGCGKSTLLLAVAGALRTQRGSVRNDAASAQALLPQSPKALLARETVREELQEWSCGRGYDEAHLDGALEEIGLLDAAERHPYDLSGGQQQLLALEKLLLARPRLLLLDEPTKGLDRASRERVARRVAAARDGGATVLLATHDLDFVRSVADSVSLMFDGGVTVSEPVDEFMSASWLYR